MDAKAVLTSMLAEADIRVGGDRPWDIRVHNEGLYKRVLREGTLGAGEAYLEGWWDCDQLDVMFCKALHAHLEDKVRRNLPNALIVASQLLFNLQSVARAPMVAEQHYNTDNAMFARMLGPTMNYSCGYWKDAETLDEAQRNKMELICRKLDLKEGMSVLDIGCGWGWPFLIYGQRIRGEGHRGHDFHGTAGLCPGTRCRASRQLAAAGLPFHGRAVRSHRLRGDVRARGTEKLRYFHEDDQTAAETFGAVPAAYYRQQQEEDGNRSVDQ